jgi:hypothetical protein
MDRALAEHNTLDEDIVSSQRELAVLEVEANVQLSLRTQVFSGRYNDSGTGGNYTA